MVLNTRNKIEDMSIGDTIPCRYTATSGVAGVFSELGTCIAPEISTTGEATPDGKFNFIKVDKGLLIADRVVQIGISWDALNSAKYIQGIPLKVPLTLYSTSSNYSDSAGRMSGAILVANTKSTNWYASYWCPQGSDASPSVILKLPQIIDVPNCVITAHNGAHGVVLDNTVTISTSLTPSGPYKIVLSAPIKAGITNYILPDNSSALYLKFSFLRKDSTYGYNNITMSDIRIPINQLVRSLSGGNAYLGTDGKASLTDKGLGAWPINNEWDKYIVNNDLGRKITPGDDSVWHWNLLSLCQDTPANGINQVSSPGIVGSNAQCINRGYYAVNRQAFIGSGIADAPRGFRPVLEYPRCTNIWY